MQLLEHNHMLQRAKIKKKKKKMIRLEIQNMYVDFGKIYSLQNIFSSNLPLDPKNHPRKRTRKAARTARTFPTIYIFSK